MNQAARDKIQASEVKIEFDKYNMHWAIRRYYIPYKDSFEYIIYVHNFERHHLRERFDWELTAEELEEHFEPGSTAISQYEIDKLVECIVNEFISHAALCLHLAGGGVQAWDKPVIREGAAVDYWDRKMLGLKTN